MKSLPADNLTASELVVYAGKCVNVRSPSVAVNDIQLLPSFGIVTDIPFSMDMDLGVRLLITVVYVPRLYQFQERSALANYLE